MNLSLLVNKIYDYWNEFFNGFLMVDIYFEVKNQMTKISLINFVNPL